MNTSEENGFLDDLCSRLVKIQLENSSLKEKGTIVDNMNDEILSSISHSSSGRNEMVSSSDSAGIKNYCAANSNCSPQEKKTPVPHLSSYFPQEMHRQINEDMVQEVNVQGTVRHRDLEIISLSKQENDIVNQRIAGQVNESPNTVSSQKNASPVIMNESQKEYREHDVAQEQASVKQSLHYSNNSQKLDARTSENIPVSKTEVISPNSQHLIKTPTCSKIDATLSKSIPLGESMVEMEQIHQDAGKDQFLDSLIYDNIPELNENPLNTTYVEVLDQNSFTEGIDSPLTDTTFSEITCESYKEDFEKSVIKERTFVEKYTGSQVNDTVNIKANDSEEFSLSDSKVASLKHLSNTVIPSDASRNLDMLPKNSRGATDKVNELAQINQLADCHSHSSSSTSENFVSLKELNKNCLNATYVEVLHQNFLTKPNDSSMTEIQFSERASEPYKQDSEETLIQELKSESQWSHINNPENDRITNNSEEYPVCDLNIVSPLKHLAKKILSADASIGFDAVLTKSESVSNKINELPQMSQVADSHKPSSSVTSSEDFTTLKQPIEYFYNATSTEVLNHATVTDHKDSSTTEIHASQVTGESHKEYLEENHAENIDGNCSEKFSVSDSEVVASVKHLAVLPADASTGFNAILTKFSSTTGQINDFPQVNQLADLTSGEDLPINELKENSLNATYEYVEVLHQNSFMKHSDSSMTEIQFSEMTCEPYKQHLEKTYVQELKPEEQYKGSHVIDPENNLKEKNSNEFQISDSKIVAPLQHLSTIVLPVDSSRNVDVVQAKSISKSDMAHCTRTTTTHQNIYESTEFSSSEIAGVTCGSQENDLDKNMQKLSESSSQSYKFAEDLAKWRSTEIPVAVSATPHSPSNEVVCRSKKGIDQMNASCNSTKDAKEDIFSEAALITTITSNDHVYRNSKNEENLPASGIASDEDIYSTFTTVSISNVSEEMETNTDNMVLKGSCQNSLRNEDNVAEEKIVKECTAKRILDTTFSNNVIPNSSKETMDSCCDADECSEFVSMNSTFSCDVASEHNANTSTEVQYLSFSVNSNTIENVSMVSIASETNDNTIIDNLKQEGSKKAHKSSNMKDGGLNYTFDEEDPKYAGIVCSNSEIIGSVATNDHNILSQKEQRETDVDPQTNFVQDIYKNRSSQTNNTKGPDNTTNYTTMHETVNFCKQDHELPQAASDLKVKDQLRTCSIEKIPAMAKCDSIQTLGASDTETTSAFQNDVSLKEKKCGFPQKVTKHTLGESFNMEETVTTKDHFDFLSNVCAQESEMLVESTPKVNQQGFNFLLDDEVFKDPSTFDILTQFGNGKSQCDLRKQSLYVKFDPLLGSPRSVTTSSRSASLHNERIGKKYDCSENVSCAKNSEKELALGDNLKTDQMLISTSEGYSSKTMMETDVSEIEEELVSLRAQVSQLQELLREKDELLKSEASRYRSQVIALDFTVTERNEEVKSLQKLLENSKKENEETSKALAESLDLLDNLLGEKEKNSKEMEKLKVELEEDKKTIVTVQAELWEAKSKNEHMKVVIKGLVEKEAKLISSYQKKVDFEKEKYSTLKSHAVKQLESANETFAMKEKRHKLEYAKYTSTIEKLELKLKSLQDELELEKRENKNLMTIYKDLGPYK